MKRMILLLLCGAALCSAKPTYLLAQEVCVQEDFRAQCPVAIDPNLAALAVLGPVAHDPNVWEVPVGKFNRVIEICQDQGNPVKVTLVDTNSDGSSIVTDPNGVVTLSAEVLPGVRWWVIRATSVPLYGQSASRDVAIVAHVPYPPNTPPTIARLHRALQWHFMRAAKVNEWDGRGRIGPKAQAWVAETLKEIQG